MNRLSDASQEGQERSHLFVIGMVVDDEVAVGGIGEHACIATKLSSSHEKCILITAIWTRLTMQHTILCTVHFRLQGKNQNSHAAARVILPLACGK